MEIKKITNKNEWNEFLDNFHYFSFLQDFEYGQIEESLGREVFRLGLYQNKDLKGLCQIIGYQGKRKGLVVHHGPVIKEELLEKGLKEILLFLKEEKISKKYNFLRINPTIESSKEKLTLFFNLGFNLAPTYAVTENFWIKDLKSDEKMLQEMKKSHRQAIIDSLKKPYLEILIDENLNFFEKFWEIYQEMAQRKKFVPYSKEFLKRELEFFKKKAKLFLAQAEGKIYGGAIIIFSHKKAFYHQAASIPLKEPLEYKMQWLIMQKAKELGCQEYNFWGIAKKERKNHPWFGLTQFKKGFGGKMIQLLPTVDYKFSLKYWLNYFYEKYQRRNL